MCVTSSQRFLRLCHHCASVINLPLPTASLYVLLLHNLFIFFYLVIFPSFSVCDLLFEEYFHTLTQFSLVSCTAIYFMVSVLIISWGEIHNAGDRFLLPTNGLGCHSQWKTSPSILCRKQWWKKHKNIQSCIQNFTECIKVLE